MRSLCVRDDQVLAAHLEQIKPVYCRFCGHCDGVCAKGLPVADMLRILTYADGYRQFALARERFQELPAQHNWLLRRLRRMHRGFPHGVHVSAQLARRRNCLHEVLFLVLDDLRGTGDISRAGLSQLPVRARMGQVGRKAKLTVPMICTTTRTAAPKAISSSASRACRASIASSATSPSRSTSPT